MRKGGSEEPPALSFAVTQKHAGIDCNSGYRRPCG